LAIAPQDGDLAEILNKTEAGVVVDFDDKNTLKSIILELYSKYKQGNLSVNSKNIEQFHRRELTKNIAEILKELTFN
jgi:hypothetical protein